MKDTLYQFSTSENSDIAPFEFNHDVVQAFEDMIRRSVPGYRASLELAMTVATQICQPNDHVYDLGCSLGAATFALLNQTVMPSLHLKAVDISEPMLHELLARIYSQSSMTDPFIPKGLTFPQVITKIGCQNHTVSLILEDITQMNFEPCKLVFLNYVLQFIPIQHRLSLLKKIFDALPKGGAIILSEKVIHEDQQQQEVLNTLHLQFKRLQGYSDMEIDGKRIALEGVLIPETIQTHQQRLLNIGFTHVSVAASQLNFMSIIAIK